MDEWQFSSDDVCENYLHCSSRVQRETQFDTYGKITSLGKLKKRVVMIQAAGTELLQWSL